MSRVTIAASCSACRCRTPGRSAWLVTTVRVCPTRRWTLPATDWVNATRCASHTIDARVSKDFFLGRGAQRLSAFVEVDNLFNRRNVINVYARTGQPNNDGVRQGAGLSLNQQELDQLDYLFDNDPQNYSPPRTVRIGVEFNF